MDNKQVYELTFEEWQQAGYQNIKTKYPNAEEKNIINTVNSKKQKWINALIEASQSIILSDRVIDSYVDLLGKNDLYRTFRGIYSTGISQWEPKEVRLYDKSYQWMLEHRNELLLQKGSVKAFYNGIIDKAKKQGKIA